MQVGRPDAQQQVALFLIVNQPGLRRDGLAQPLHHARIATGGANAKAAEAVGNVQAAHALDLPQQAREVLMAQQARRPRDGEVLHQIDGVALADRAQGRQIAAVAEG